MADFFAKRRVVAVGAVGALLVFGASSAWSKGGQGPTAGSPANPASDEARQLREHVARLERRVQQLEQRLREAEQRAEASPPTAQFPSPSPSRAARPQRVTATSGADDCSQLEFFDARGVRRFKLQCLSALANQPCDPPFTMDAKGIKRVNPSCLTAER